MSEPLGLRFQPPVITAVMNSAPFEAYLLGHHHLGLEHIAIALTRAEGGVTMRLLQHLALEPHDMRMQLRSAAHWDRHILQNGTLVVRPRRLTPTPRLQMLLATVQIASVNVPVSERALLLMLLRAGPSVVVRTLQAIAHEDIATLITTIEADDAPEATTFRTAFWQQPHDSAPVASVHTDPLHRYTHDLAQEGASGAGLPLYGQDSVLRDIARILTGATHQVAVLVGPSGVGKTAIARGFARRLVDSERPLRESLRGWHVVRLDAARFRVEVESRGGVMQRIQAVLDACAEHGNIMLAIDDITTLPAEALPILLKQDQVRVLATATADDYERLIATTTLARWCAPISVTPLTATQTEEYLLTARPHWEERLHLGIDEGAIVAAIDLSDRYLPERCFPEKAAMLLDRSCQQVAVSRMTRYDAALVAPRQVTAHDVTASAATLFHVPLGTLTEEFRFRLQSLDSTLSRTIGGQSTAIEQVARAVRQGWSTVRPSHRPRAVILCVGPTGTGKTATARALAAALYSTPPHFLKLDMTAFGDATTRATLVGAAPGYADADQGGVLTHWLRDHPNSLVVLDEIDRADPVIWNELLSLFDEGTITDGLGHPQSGRDALFVMTANVPLTVPAVPDDNAQREDTHLREQLATTFGPAFVGRIDRIVLYRPFDDEGLREVAAIQYERLQDRLKHIPAMLIMDTATWEALLAQGRAATGGARAIIRIFEDAVIPGVESVLAQQLAPASIIRVTYQGSTYRVTAEVLHG